MWWKFKMSGAQSLEADAVSEFGFQCQKVKSTERANNIERAADEDCADASTAMDDYWNTDLEKKRKKGL